MLNQNITDLWTVQNNYIEKEASGVYTKAPVLRYYEVRLQFCDLTCLSYLYVYVVSHYLSNNICTIFQKRFR